VRPCQRLSPAVTRVASSNRWFGFVSMRIPGTELTPSGSIVACAPNSMTP
jgi:hypothetical protein